MATISTDLATLKHELQNRQDDSEFEHLAAALLSHLLDVPVTVAASGFQYGADAGAVGQRRLRLECKKYRDTTRFNERELLGEIDQALARDEALEAWILVTTRAVPEQIQQSLDSHGEQRGVPVVVIDWGDHEIPPLGALCIANPDLVERRLSIEAGAAARSLQSISGHAITSLRRSLEAWCLGLASLRQQSHRRLNKIWTSPRDSSATFGQNAAGGSQEKRIRREAVHEDLDKWWNGSARNDAPAVVIGREGTGKTWAVLDWLTAKHEEQPAVLVVPSSSVNENVPFSESNLMQFLAERLHDVSGVRDATHWLRRINRLLKRPENREPKLTIFFDGLNQEPSVSWLSLLKILQGETCSGKIRVIISTRLDHFGDRLSRLSGLVVPAFEINVGRYDKTPGGELDEMLGYHGIVRDDLHPDVLEMARTPRLLDLVVRFRDRLGDSGQVTIHRLLWEYGRDTAGIRAGKSFSEEEWRSWLREMAERHREGIQEFSIRSLGETVSRPDLTEVEVYRRLSDIIDGRFANIRAASGDLHLTPSVVAHALGVALLSHLDQVTPSTFDALDVRLREWLDPIAGFDQPAEVLRAAISILVEQGRAGIPKTPSVLLTAWLQAQNVTDAHREEVIRLAPNFPEALLDAVESSENRLHDSARSWAIKALREIPRNDSEVFTMIVERASGWLSAISRDIDTGPSANKEHNEWRSEQLRQRIGTDAVGPISVVGLALHLVDDAPSRAKLAIPSIIEGFPLSGALPVFEAAAAELAVTGQSECWSRLKWLCLLNEVDPTETARHLRNLAYEVSHREARPDVHPDLPKHIAALLLWLTGQEVDGATAASLEPHIGRTITYEQDYLLKPSRSHFTLERRHAQITLNDIEISSQVRASRIGTLWLDPTFVPAGTFLEELGDVATSIEVEKLSRQGVNTIEEHNFEQFEPALARFAPDVLADILRRKMLSLSTCPRESHYWMAIDATDHCVLAGQSEIAAAQALRMNRDVSDRNSDCFAAHELILMEIRDLDARQQVDALIHANFDFLLMRISEVLRPLTPEDVDALVDSYKTGSLKQQRDLLTLLSSQVIDLTDHAWSWIEQFREPQEHEKSRKFTFKILAHANLERLGRTLLDENWSWSPHEDIWVNHYGTDALIEATSALPFDRLAPRLAPWRLLEAVRRRGTEPDEVQLAARIFGRALVGNESREFDPGSDLYINLTTVKSSPFVYSLKVRPSDNENENLRLAMDAEAQTQAQKRSIETAASRILEARQAGADLLHLTFGIEDFEAVLRCAPDIVYEWLEGYSGPTVQFQRRVRLAEGVFLALCEVLLAQNPEVGSDLWRILRLTMMTRYVGEAGVDELLHMPFRVPDSSAIDVLRREIMDPEHCGTDQHLFDVAIAATLNGKVDWLNTVIREDYESQYEWRRRRAIVLEGFLTGNTLPITGAWPGGQLKTNHAWLRWKSAHLRYMEASARHWWRVYLTTPSPVEAYAAWILFLRSADRRVRVWMQEDEDSIEVPGKVQDFVDLKRIHVRLNQNILNRAIKKREEKFDQNFLHCRVEPGIGPWT